jgi:3-phenylpropionate/trans-cinnamate dioxygenase ferredoxin reductase component
VTGTIVIVGAGLAGHRAAQTLRRAGFGGELVMVGDEVHRPYDRPPLSKQVLAGTMEPAACFFGGDELAVKWLLGQPATGLDPGAQVVHVGERPVPYDGLIIATGRRARSWPALPDLAGFHMLRGLDDALALQRAASRDTRVAIVGAGFIGCEVAATLRGLGVEDVTLIEMAPYPMPALGPVVGARAAALHESHGVRLRMGASVAGFEGGSGRVEAVVLDGGERLPADLVLLALGSVPNTEWLRGSGLALERGNVLCDERCFAVGVGAGVDNIVAAGDVAAYPHPLAPDPIWIEHWSNAREMGAIAAANLLAAGDGPTSFAAVPTFWSDQYDVKIKSAGLLGGADSYEIVEDDPERRALVVEAYRDGRLVGAIAFNRNRTIIDYQRRLGAALVGSA